MAVVTQPGSQLPFLNTGGIREHSGTSVTEGIKDGHSRISATELSPPCYRVTALEFICSFFSRAEGPRNSHEVKHLLQEEETNLPEWTELMAESNYIDHLIKWHRLKDRDFIK